VPDSKDYNFSKIPSAVFLEMVHKTIYAAAGEDARFSLNGIYTEKTEDGKQLRMVATDGHRLSMIERDLEQVGSLELTEGVILPRKGMNEAAKLLEEVEGDIGVSIQSKMACFNINDSVIFMRLVDGKFPDYRRVIIEGCDKQAKVSKEELLRNLRRVSIMVDEKARAVKFSFANKTLSLESKNPNFGSSYSELEIEYEGSEIVMAFNDRYFIDIMNVSKSDSLKIELRDEQSPAIVRVDDDPAYTCVVMPMRF
jgi:DNA polymerase-3 subunit beta